MLKDIKAGANRLIISTIAKTVVGSDLRKRFGYWELTGYILRFSFKSEKGQGEIRGYKTKDKKEIVIEKHNMTKSFFDELVEKLASKKTDITNLHVLEFEADYAEEKYTMTAYHEINNELIKEKIF